MKKIIAVIAVSAALGGCTTTEKSAAIGAGTGAVAGALISGNARGAAVGALVGGAAGALLGSVRGQPGKCRYSDGRGGSYIAAC
ncbi:MULTISPECIES: YMGG-like glycine zipper-containing protein [unclassified Lentilitoribacter]|jgi:phage tail tape-measure protein|uniref:YMGG-like glycine zipper-containing protein n=1 Tax=unclassified Lentilitoribacter TaxID=2647570 RepID=UPI0013A6B6DF|nr:YMGG-like glycine zipper-containing protein [Lentilitoribacter sp. Alg239-R112]